MYYRYRSSGLRAPSARQTRGVFHGLEPMKKRMVCCTSILKVRTKLEKKREEKPEKMREKVDSISSRLLPARARISYNSVGILPSHLHPTR